MKDNAAKIFLYISLVPYGLVLLCLVLNGAVTGAVGLFYVLCYSVPVIPICLIYQAAYILRRMQRREKAAGQINGFAKSFFKLSFLPYALILLCGIMGVIVDFDDYFFPWGFYYGFRRGTEGAIYTAWYSGVMPVCMIYQLAYILRHTVKAIRKIGRKKYAAIVIGISLITAGAVLWDINQDNIKNEIKDARQRHQARELLERTDEKIEYGWGGTARGILDIKEIQHSTILIDYGEPEVGLLVLEMNEFWSTKLTEASPDSEVIRHISEDYYVQIDIRLGSPGKRLISFTDGRFYNDIIAFILVTEDGTAYYADNIADEDSENGKYCGYTDSRSAFYVGKGVRLSDLEPLTDNAKS